MNIELDNLRKIIKELRDEKYPDIPDSVIDKIISSSSEHQDDPSAALPEIRTIVSDYIKSK